jgi:hypothetical protein
MREKVEVLSKLRAKIDLYSENSDELIPIVLRALVLLLEKD